MCLRGVSKNFSSLAIVFHPHKLCYNSTTEILVKMRVQAVKNIGPEVGVLIGRERGVRPPQGELGLEVEF